MTTATVWIEGRVYGQATLEPQFVRGDLLTPDSAVFVCPQCGEAWARITVPGRRFFPWSKSCELHPPLYRDEFPGSLWLSWDPALCRALPREVLLREFKLALAQYDKESKHEGNG